MRKTRKLCPLCGGKMRVMQEQSSYPYLSCESCFLDYGALAFRSVKDLIESFEGEAKNKKTLGRTKPKPVVKITEDGKVLERYKSLSEAAKKNPMSKTSIENRTRRKLKNEFAVCDFTFRLEDDIY